MQGHFPIIKLSGEYVKRPDDSSGLVGGMEVEFVGGNGRTIEGAVESLIAAFPIQVSSICFIIDVNSLMSGSNVLLVVWVVNWFFSIKI